jgi:hypothetical protein
MLLEKNDSYGDSAINPVRIFSKSDALEQINVRIDDKLNRIIQGKSYDGDNDEDDLIGYLILKKVKRRLDNENNIPEGVREFTHESATHRNTDQVLEESGGGRSFTPEGQRIYEHIYGNVLDKKDCKCGSEGAHRVQCPAHPRKRNPIVSSSRPENWNQTKLG